MNKYQHQNFCRIGNALRPHFKKSNRNPDYQLDRVEAPVLSSAVPAPQFPMKKRRPGSCTEPYFGMFRKIAKISLPTFIGYSCKPKAKFLLGIIPMRWNGPSRGLLQMWKNFRFSAPQSPPINRKFALPFKFLSSI